jgi:exosortase
VDTVTLPLRQVSTDIAVTIASTGLGIDVIQDGVRIMDPAGTYQYEVAAACSGIRSLVSLAALTTIYGFVNFHTWWKPWLFMALAIPLAIVGNIIRLTMIIVGTEAFNTSVGMFIHEWFGFVTFAVALGVVLALGAWLRDEDLSTDPGPKLEPNAA